ncbi:hypothetical protein NDN08_004781 [Rhodosorus marinus]|uniref:Protein translocase subunit SecA n=1 Tax=Rhodosorus marinus TaxID=101924 RepID=A0AAV8UM82_9RHOD|nr:hypothetical protein NDN08_004781 [Rhodosorus marinus]
MGLFDGLKKAVAGVSNENESAGSDVFASTLGVSDEAQKILEGYQARVVKINGLEDGVESLDDGELKARATALKKMVQAGEASLDDVLEESFALVREAAFRAIGLRHYDVQLMGGMALHDGKIAEMATGEGKTLVATLAAFLNALEGRGVCIVTVNDYLAKRDADQMGKIFRFLGLSVGLIQSDVAEPIKRRDAYACDITYVTNSELGFDYLRDNLAMQASEIVMRSRLSYCILDEADSILIDEARTPLIISGKVDAPTKKYQAADKIANFLEKDVHYTVAEKEQSVILTEQGQRDCEQALGGRDLFGLKDPWINFIVNAIKSRELFIKDANYIIEDGEVVIVDEFTGRAMKGRRWGDGVHQAVEVKEGIVTASETQNIASISYQSLFSEFEKFGGMTGTALTEEKEFASIYGLQVLPIPTALPKARKDYPDAVFKTREGKVRAIMREIALEHTKGRPLLVGTTSIEDSEMISGLLADVECPHEVLNAKPENVARESEIIAQAGRQYAITIATNMAGRGTDILLGGNPDYLARDIVKVIAAEQLETSHTGVTDDSLQISQETLEEIEAAVAECREVLPDLDLDTVVAIATESTDLGENQLCATNLQSAFEAAKEELRSQLADEKEEVLKLGGLYIIGTNRHESRRIDNQLRGRSGRQGDPGASRFFLALDDPIFAMFGGEKLKGLMSAFRVDENTPIENKQVSNALDSSQSNVETYYYDMRKLLWDYDQVVGQQRNKYYEIRKEILKADPSAVSEKVLEWCLDTEKSIVKAQQGNKDKMAALLTQFFPALTSTELANMSSCDLEAEIKGILARKEAELENVKEGFSTEVIRFLVLQVMDNLWKSHLRDLDYLKQVIAVRAYGSEKPLDEYQNEGFKLFTDMTEAITRNSVYSLFQYKVGAQA